MNCYLWCLLGSRRWLEWNNGYPTSFPTLVVRLAPTSSAFCLSVTVTADFKSALYRFADVLLP